uniref:Uncharacterized protein n=1 Tax=Alexandrium andersonii TaxID=327968 RepID=A0A7S2GJD7_9DINO
MCQCQEALFGERGSRAGSLGLKNDRKWDSPRRLAGLGVEGFIEALVSLRWDLAASSLDTASLSASINNCNKPLHKCLDNVEASLQRSLGNISAQRKHMQDDEATAKLSSLSEELPLACARDLDLHRLSSEVEVASGARSASWLHRMPTEILFLALTSRSVPSPTNPVR